MSDCRKCVDFDWCVENEDCGLFKLKPMTNADCIRAMSDEELAEVLDGSICPQGYNQLGECEASKEICHTCWLDWLKQECAE